MWVRKRIDISWSDLGYGALRAHFPRDRLAIQRDVERSWSDSEDVLACLSVRSGLDLFFSAAELPRRSEVLISAVTIPDMVRIIEHHGLVPVPVDLDLGRLAPNVELLRRAVTPATRAVLVAHLFGARFPMGPILELARQHKLMVIEDCAQAFAGPRYRGHPDADVSMFSFGPIKTATALGGAILRVGTPELLRRMRARQAGYPVQSRWSYLRRLLKYVGLKAGSTRPVFTAVVCGCRAFECNPDRAFNGFARGFAGAGFFTRLRQQPSAPLLAVLKRRLQTFDADRLKRRTWRGEFLAQLLHQSVPCPGAEIDGHTYWVFPILADDPSRVIAMLARAGFDATQGQSMCVVTPPADRPELDPTVARDAMSKMVYLPFYPEMPTRSLRQMAEVLVQDRSAVGGNGCSVPKT